MRYLKALFLIMFCTVGYAQAQRLDSVRREIQQVSVDSLNMQDTTNIPTDTNVEKAQKQVEEEEPMIYKDSTRLALEKMTRTAVRRSAILPGWGQLSVNKKWWKVPIIYGGVVGLVISYDVAQSGYKEMLKEAQFRINNNGLPENEKYAMANQEWIIQAKDFYRRNRDLTILLSLGLYALNLVDAYIDAKMFRYDISDDLAFKIHPHIEPPVGPFAAKTPVFGMKMAFTIH